MSIFDEIGKGFRDAGNSISTRTKEFSTTSNAKSEIARLNTEITKQYTALGQVYYEYSIDPANRTLEVQPILQNISDCFRKINEQQALIDQVNADVAARKEEAERQRAEYQAQKELEAQKRRAEIEAKKEELRAQKEAAAAGTAGTVGAGAAFAGVAGASAAQAAGAVCAHCGAPLAPNSRFCMSCGTPVAQQEEKEEAPAGKTCPNCGGAVAEDAVFCMNCGTKLGESS